MIRHLSETDFRLMPWVNGKGTTIEMLKVEREGRLWLRLSRAMVVETGAFSLFPGVDRNLTVLSGPGFDLVGEGIHLSARPLIPLPFPGDIPLQAVAVSAPCEDFNVMAPREAGPARVWLQQSGDAPAGSAILALAPGVIGGFTVLQYDLILTDRVISHTCPVVIVQAAGL